MCKRGSSERLNNVQLRVSLPRVYQLLDTSNPTPGSNGAAEGTRPGGAAEKTVL